MEIQTVPCEVRQLLLIVPHSTVQQLLKYGVGGNICEDTRSSFHICGPVLPFVFN